jgi:hypothetical protein
MVRGAQPVLKPLLLVVYACFTLSVARERGQHDESEVASEFEAKRNKLGLRSKLALPIAGQPRVARSLGGKLGQLQSAITLRPNSRTPETEGADCRWRQQGAREAGGRDASGTITVNADAACKKLWFRRCYSK